METVIYTYLGYGLLLCASLIVLVPAVVWLGNNAMALLWQFVDEGETPWVHRFTSTYLVQKVPVFAAGYSCGSGYTFYFNGDSFCATFFDRAKLFINKCDVEEILKHKIPTGQYFIKETSDGVVMVNRIYLMVCMAAAGVGLCLVPTLTLIAAASVGTLYSMRWARRAIKYAKRVKSSLDSHVADKDAHK